jgi:hypothetical protein
LDAAVERVAIGDVGKSGAVVERLLMPDGGQLVVKRVSSSGDLFMRLMGFSTYPELNLWRTGVLDALPAPAGHAVVDGWVDGDDTVLVMRDLGDTVLSWDDRLSRAECRRLLAAVVGVHREFLESAPDGLTPLARLVSMFAPQRVAPFSADDALAQLCLRGWDLFGELVPGEIAHAVLALLEDPTPLVLALESRPTTLVHGDLATVNVALEAKQVTLLDWAMPACAPGAVDVARFLAGCASVVDASREDVLADYRELAGAAYDEKAMRLALLSGLVWLGWNKALDSAEHPDPAKREQEEADLAWWVNQARTTLDLGLL